MKKIIIGVLILLIIGVIAYVFVNYDNQSLKTNTENTAQNTTENTNVENSSQDIEQGETENIANEDEEKIWEIKKVNNTDFNNNYTIEEQYKIINEKYFNINKQGEQLTITLIDSDENNNLLGDTSGLEYNKEYVINNSNANNIKSIFCGGEGQDLMYPLVFLLQQDGTVQGIDIESGYKTGNFVAKNISELKDVEKIEQASVTPKDDSGYVAVIAITKDDTVYELRKIE